MCFIVPKLETIFHEQVQSIYAVWGINTFTNQYYYSNIKKNILKNTCLSSTPSA